MGFDARPAVVPDIEPYHESSGSNLVCWSVITKSRLYITSGFRCYIISLLYCLFKMYLCYLISNGRFCFKVNYTFYQGVQIMIAKCSSFISSLFYSALNYWVIMMKLYVTLFQNISFPPNFLLDIKTS